MRVISGKYKGKKLNSPKTEHVRPTADKVKQAFFTKYQFEINNAVFLDLFSGSGAIGIEALSRNCKFVTFVDNDTTSIQLLKSNLNFIKEKNYKIVNSNSLSFLDSVKNEKFNFIFIDPPYQSNLYSTCLQKIHENQLLAENGVICLETNLDFVLECPYFSLIDEKKYGNTKLYYLQ